MSKSMQRALVALGALAVFGAVLVALVANDMPLTKEFIGAIAGGVVSVITLVYAGKANDEAKAAKDEAVKANQK